MKLLTASIALLTSAILSAQSWVPLMEDRNANFYEVEQEFLNWYEPIAADIEQRALTESHPERETLKNQIRRYKAWAKSARVTMDAHGFQLTQEQLEQRAKTFHGTRKRQAAQQVGWEDFGPLMPGYRGLGVVQCVAGSPADTNVLYVGTWSSGVWRSNDQGQSWHPILDSLARYVVYDVEVDPNDADVAYVVHPTNVLKTTDGGVTWTALNPPGMDADGTPGFNERGQPCIIIDPNNTQVLYLSGDLSIPLLRSSDGGATWAAHNSATIVGMEFRPGSSSVIYGISGGTAANSRDWLLRSLDGGLTFDTIAGSQSDFLGVAVTPADPMCVYAYEANLPAPGPDGRVLRSLDGGTTFQTQPLYVGLTSFYRNNTIAVSHFDRDIIVAGGISLMKTEDGGVTWGGSVQHDIDLPNFVHVDQRSVEFIHGKWWLCNDGGIFRSVNNGVSWEDMTNNMGIGNIKEHARPMIDTTALATAIDHNSLGNRAGGMTYRSPPIGDGFNVAVDPFDPLHLIGRSQSSVLTVTFDGWATETGVPMPSGGISFTSNYRIRFHPQSSDTVFTIRDDVLRSTDGGLSWTILSNFQEGTGGGVLEVSQADPSVILTAFHRTRDGGATWHRFENEKSGHTFGALACHPNDPAQIWGVNRFGPNIVFHSADTGRTWTPIPSFDLPSTLYDRSLVMVDDGHNSLYLSTDVGVFFYNDLMSNWQPYNEGLPFTYFRDMHYHPMDQTLSLTCFGRGVWKAPLFDHSLPPQAGLLVADTSACPGQAVQFYDNSINNGPGYAPVYQWSFPGGVPSTSNQAHPVVAYPNAGTYSATLVITNANGTDSITVVNTITVENPLGSLPLNEGFEIIDPLPDGWEIVDPDGWSSWWLHNAGQNQIGGYAQSAGVARITTLRDACGTDALLTPSYSLSAPTTWYLLYDRAYRSHSDSTRVDSLHVFYTSNCDDSRTTLLTVGGNDLATTGPPSNVSFTPSDSSEWTTDTIALVNLPALDTLRFGFEILTHAGVNLILDNVRLVQSISTNIAEDDDATWLSAWPNPTSNDVTMQVHDPNVQRIAVHDVNGRVVHQQQVGSQQFVINTTDWSEGVYHVQCDERTLGVRLVVIH